MRARVELLLLRESPRVDSRCANGRQTKLVPSPRLSNYSVATEACRTSKLHRQPSAQAAPHLSLFFRLFHKAIFVQSPEIQAANYENLGIVRHWLNVSVPEKCRLFYLDNKVPFGRWSKWGEMANPEVIAGAALGGVELVPDVKILRLPTNQPVFGSACSAHQA